MGVAVTNRERVAARRRPAVARPLTVQRKGAGCKTCCDACAKSSGDEDTMVQTLRAADPGSRQRMLEQLQAGAGNQAVQRLLAGAPTAQRAGGAPMLRIGSSGPAVTTLQQQLNSRGAQLVADGRFGPATAAAVRSFQASVGLPADGIVGPKTAGALDSGGGGSGPAPAGSAKGTALLQARLNQALAVVQGLPRATTAGGAAAPPRVGMGTVQRDLWDDITGAAADAADAVSDTASDVGGAVGGAVDAATDWVGDTAQDVADWAGETAGDVADWAGETAQDVADWAGEVVEDVVEVVSDPVGAITEVWNDIKGAAAEVGEQLSSLADDVKERYAEELAILAEVARALGRGAGLSDEEINALLGRLGVAVAGLTHGAEALGEGTCTEATPDVAFTDSSFTVNARGLGHVHEQVSAKLGGAGHVTLSAMPSMKVTCEKPGTDGKPVVGAAKVTAKGSIVMPAKGKVGTTSADPTREAKGVDDYFNIVRAHETQHADIYKTAFTGAQAKLIGTPVADAQTAFNTIVCDAFKAQDALDKAGGCVELCCSPGDNAKDATQAGASSCGLTPNAAGSCP